MLMTWEEGKWAFTHSNWVCTVTEIFDTALNNFWSRHLLLGPEYSLQGRPFSVTMTFKTSSSKVNLTLFSISSLILQTFQRITTIILQIRLRTDKHRYRFWMSCVMTLKTEGYLNYKKLNRINTLFYLVEVHRKFNGQWSHCCLVRKMNL